MFLIGCPAYKRAWILPEWFRSSDLAASRAGYEPQYLFVCVPDDIETIDVIRQHKNTEIVFVAQDAPQEKRVWNRERYHEMVLLRNALLQNVRVADPELFLSLDSDILLHSDAISGMVEGLDLFDAVGGKAYMSRGFSAPSYAKMVNNHMVRKDFWGLAKVDIIMAVKLMTDRAYWVDYKWDSHGEDVGWSLACKEAGLTLGWDGRYASKHVMLQESLHAVDDRCGF